MLTVKQDLLSVKLHKNSGSKCKTSLEIEVLICKTVRVILGVYRKTQVNLDNWRIENLDLNCHLVSNANPFSMSTSRIYPDWDQVASFKSPLTEGEMFLARFLDE